MEQPTVTILLSYATGTESVPNWIKQEIINPVTSMKKALEKHGAEVKTVDASTTTLSPEESITGVDALIVMGGSDVDPAFYGQPETAKLENPNLESDRYEAALIENSIDNEMFTFGVCRGAQLINATLGGTLIQHLENVASHRNESRNENNPSSSIEHSVTIQPGSLLHQIFETDNIMVRSEHHQALDQLGKGLTVTARSDDGVIEAVENPAKDIYAVQWHPEDQEADEEALNTLVKKLISRIAAKKNS